MSKKKKGYRSGLFGLKSQSTNQGFWLQEITDFLKDFVQLALIN